MSTKSDNFVGGDKMDKFDIGEIAICIRGIHTGECEIVSPEYEYDGDIGYDVIFPGAPCKKTDSRFGEWFCETQQLRKKNPPQESKDITETRQKGKDAPTQSDIFKMFEDAGKVKESQA
jgi:hypothetical protein